MFMIDVHAYSFSFLQSLLKFEIDILLFNDLYMNIVN